MHYRYLDLLMLSYNTVTEMSFILCLLWKNKTKERSTHELNYLSVKLAIKEKKSFVCTGMLQKSIQSIKAPDNTLFSKRNELRLYIVSMSMRDL